jgi:hypothetical protein
MRFLLLALAKLYKASTSVGMHAAQLVRRSKLHSGFKVVREDGLTNSGSLAHARTAGPNAWAHTDQRERGA